MEQVRITKQFVAEQAERKGMIMKKYFYTFGTSKEFPYYKGYVIVHAPNMKIAHETFKKYHPNRCPRTLNCADFYAEKQFEETGMNDGSWGNCHNEYTYEK